jgi:hypothetical protein
VEELEANARQVCQNTPDSEIEAEMWSWIPDAGSTRSREAKYFKTLKLFWIMKSLLGQAITHKKSILNSLLMQTEYLQIYNQAMDKKITIIVAHLGIKFVDYNGDSHQTPKAHENPLANPTS